jgi:hypothetical protein
MKGREGAYDVLTRLRTTLLEYKMSMLKNFGAGAAVAKA